MSFTRGILRLCGFYRSDPLILRVLADGSSDFASFLHLDCHFSHTKNDAITGLNVHVKILLYGLMVMPTHHVNCEVLETNSWRDRSKPMYVLIHSENQLCNMKTSCTIEL